MIKNLKKCIKNRIFINITREDIYIKNTENFYRIISVCIVDKVSNLQKEVIDEKL